MIAPSMYPTLTLWMVGICESVTGLGRDFDFLVLVAVPAAWPDRRPPTLDTASGAMSPLFEPTVLLSSCETARLSRSFGESASFCSAATSWQRRERTPKIRTIRIIVNPFYQTCCSADSVYHKSIQTCAEKSTIH